MSLTYKGMLTSIALTPCFLVASGCTGSNEGGDLTPAATQSIWGEAATAKPGECLTNFLLQPPSIVSCDSEEAAFEVIDIWSAEPPNQERRCPDGTAGSTVIPEQPPFVLCYAELRSPAGS